MFVLGLITKLAVFCAAFLCFSSLFQYGPAGFASGLAKELEWIRSLPASFPSAPAVDSLETEELSQTGES